MANNPTTAEPGKNSPRPAAAMVVPLMFSFSAWMLMAAIHFYEKFVGPNGAPDPVKCYVTLAIAVLSTIYVVVKLLSLPRGRFDRKRTPIVLSPRHTLLVIVIVVFFGVYAT